MNLKQKSIIISFSTTLLLISTIVVVIIGITMVKFQEIENQRVERNIRRVSAIIEDRFTQINIKLADWTIWDDTYQFLQDKNQAYIDSNLAQESFITLGLDEALFINSKGGLVAGILVENDQDDEDNFPQDFYQYFSTGSALVKTNPETGNNHGLIKTDAGVSIFVVREVFQSDNTGDPAGTVVFARYFDEEVLGSMRDLTQFEASMYLWDDPEMPSDFSVAKNNYLNEDNKELIRVLDNQTISGYLVITDVFGDPQIIVRSDIGRDITTQGRSSMSMLMWILVVAGIITAGINYWLITGGVLRKVALMSSDVENLSQSGKSDKRLLLGKNNDEVDKLRIKINSMIDSLSESKSELSNKEQFINIVMDNLTIGIAVNKISTGKAIYMNKAFEKIYGWSRDVLTSVDSFFECVYPDQKTGKEIKKKVLADIATGDPEKMDWKDLEITKSTGEKRFIDARNIPLLDQDLMVSTVIDVTNSKQITDKKIKYTQELERLNKLMVNRELKMVAIKKELEKEKKS